MFQERASIWWAVSYQVEKLSCAWASRAKLFVHKACQWIAGISNYSSAMAVFTVLQDGKCKLLYGFERFRVIQDCNWRVLHSRTTEPSQLTLEDPKKILDALLSGQCLQSPSNELDFGCDIGFRNDRNELKEVGGRGAEFERWFYNCLPSSAPASNKPSFCLDAPLKRL